MPQHCAVGYPTQHHIAREAREHPFGNALGPDKIGTGRFAHRPSYRPNEPDIQAWRRLTAA